MGINIFTKYSSSDRLASFSPIKGDPIPTNFKIEKTRSVGDFTIAWVNYPDSTTFEGKKILVFNGDVRADLKTSKSLDPHFSNGVLSPVARFKPDMEGELLAYKMCSA